MIFISYGMPKSASSFVFQMTMSALKSMENQSRRRLRLFNDLFNGFPKSHSAEDILSGPLKLPRPAEVAQQRVYLDHLFPSVVDRLDVQSGDMIIIKTHMPCTKKIAEAIEDGTVLASATFRHPAEMMLSLKDMDRRDGKVPGGNLKRTYRNFESDFYSWANLPAVRKYYYDEIVVNPSFVFSDICQHVGSTGDLRTMLDELTVDKKKIWQFNNGTLNRALDEMSLEEVREIEEYFSDFMRFIGDHKAARALALEQHTNDLE